MFLKTKIIGSVSYKPTKKEMFNGEWDGLINEEPLFQVMMLLAQII